jgi:uncharacterized RDD family membrane protein YckC
MRCPKCHYISFDSGERCRNCGYDFSLSAGEPSLDLPIQDRNEPLGPLGELTLADPRIPAPPPARDVPHGAASAAGAGQAKSATPELPLFGDRRLDDDPPLVIPVIPAVPRQPLSVRRANPAGMRARARGPADEPALDLGMPQRVSRDDRSDADADATSDRTAGLVRRCIAAFIDLLILVPLDAAVIYFSLRLCGLTTADIRLLPPLPLGAFLLLLNGGYLVMFIAAGGQTIGKMATGVRVVPVADPDSDAAPRRVPFGQAIVRAAAFLVSVLPAGLGLIPALVSADRRTLHDRLSDTRVVRA